MKLNIIGSVPNCFENAALWSYAPHSFAFFLGNLLEVILFIASEVILIKTLRALNSSFFLI
jgi:hypothetical protein